jgi:hypothetical protein
MTDDERNDPRDLSGYGVTEEQVPEDGVTEDDLVEASDTFDAEEVLAVTAFVLAVLSLAGFGLLNGSTYVHPLLTADADRTRLVLGALLGAVLALVPVWLGWRVIARSLPGDPGWAMTLARSAMLLGLGSAVLRVVAAVIEAAQSGAVVFPRL